ncbi:hypothetical protein AAC387_Pa05g2635 [Persea americana]|eukprot:TRINITY_DN14087_c1_g1_i2.p1 TRINITY_DN14087_c1_g1~~TRINITY_DN14087_c1_g1_i2.p1  ORF type:complete len:667 (+),score=110.91 TRINITY_DN14087_c1_g1_i2:295-2295(+)
MSAPFPGAVEEERGIGNNCSLSGREKQAMEHSSDVIEEEGGVDNDSSSFVASISEMSPPLARIVEEEQINGNANTPSPWAIVRRALEFSSIVDDEEGCIGSSYSPPVSSSSPLPGIVDEGQSTGSNSYSVANRFEGPPISRNLECNQSSAVVYTAFEGSSFDLTPSKEILHCQANNCLIEKESPSELPAASSCSREQKHPADHSIDSRKLKIPKVSRVLFKQGNMSDGNSLTHVLELSKRPNQRNTFLSALIDSGVVLLGEEVSYVDKRASHAMKKGQITCEGIKCNCCRFVYSLSNFGRHAGSSNQRPAAIIFLQDGRSLFDCQLQLAGDQNFIGSKHMPLEKADSDGDKSEDGNMCFVCHGVGELLLCTHCPSSYHSTCVGLEYVPEEEWYCPCCRCVICDQGDFTSDSEVYTEKTVIYCDQCSQEYHVGCLRERELAELLRCPAGNWFCSKRCSEIFVSLHDLMGKANPTGLEGVTWTILPKKGTSHSVSTSTDDFITEDQRKHLAARWVLDDCFDWMPDPNTNRGIITDVLYNKQSDIPRTDYRNFFAMLLERGVEVLSVAAFRIFSEKAAQIPLIGTSRKYRRQGMCRLLMNELEKMISGLGVERLLLPAPPALLETWTTSFGFTKMTRSERLQFLQFPFMEFQETTMCQKLLMTSTTKEM